MSKYWAKSVELDWIRFDSRMEAEYYQYIKAMWYTDIIVHPKYELQPKYPELWLRAITYEADFEYKDTKWVEYVVDVKGMATTEAKLKRKFFIPRYPLKNLIRVIPYKKQWVDWFDNEARKRKNRKEKEKES